MEATTHTHYRTNRHKYRHSRHIRNPRAPKATNEDSTPVDENKTKDSATSSQPRVSSPPPTYDVEGRIKLSVLAKLHALDTTFGELKRGLRETQETLKMLRAGDFKGAMKGLAELKGKEVAQKQQELKDMEKALADRK